MGNEISGVGLGGQTGVMEEVGDGGGENDLASGGSEDDLSGRMGDLQGQRQALGLGGNSSGVMTISITIGAAAGQGNNNGISRPGQSNNAQQQSGDLTATVKALLMAVMKLLGMRGGNQQGGAPSQGSGGGGDLAQILKLLIELIKLLAGGKEKNKPQQANGNQRPQQGGNQHPNGKPQGNQGAQGNNQAGNPTNNPNNDENPIEEEKPDICPDDENECNLSGSEEGDVSGNWGYESSGGDWGESGVGGEDWGGGAPEEAAPTQEPAMADA